MLKRYEIKPEKSLGDWAVIVVDLDRGLLAVCGDRGNYANLWTDTGEADFRSFLIGLVDSPEYLCGKLSGRKVYDGEATEKAARAAVDAMPDGPEKRRNLERFEECDLSTECGFATWSTVVEDIDIYTNEMVVRVPEPDCLYFCKETYPRFVAMLRAEMEAEVLADVDRALATWKPRLVESDRESLVLLRRKAPDVFAKLYPVLPEPANR
jgi:hypothetical protein